VAAITAIAIEYEKRLSTTSLLCGIKYNKKVSH
jgi:hypothetical protein